MPFRKSKAIKDMLINLRRIVAIYFINTRKKQ